MQRVPQVAQMGGKQLNCASSAVFPFSSHLASLFANHRNMQIRARQNAFAGPRVFSKSCLLFRKSPKQLASLNCRTSKHKDVK